MKTLLGHIRGSPLLASVALTVALIDENKAKVGS